MTHTPEPPIPSSLDECRKAFEDDCAENEVCIVRHPEFSEQYQLFETQLRWMGFQAAWNAHSMRESVDFGSLAAHVASGLGAIKGYGHGDTAAAKSLQYVMDELMTLYEQRRRGSEINRPGDRTS